MSPGKTGSFPQDRTRRDLNWKLSAWQGITHTWMDRPPAYPKHTVIVMHSLLSWRSYGFSEFIARKADVSINLIYLMYFFQFPFVSIRIFTTYTYSISLCSKCQRPNSWLERVYDFVPERFRRDISIFETQRNGRMTVVRIWGVTKLFFRSSLSDPLHVPYTTDTITELKNKRPTWCHLLFYFASYVLNMFRTLIYPSSGASDCIVELSHRKTTDVIIQQYSL